MGGQQCPFHTVLPSNHVEVQGRSAYTGSHSISWYIIVYSSMLSTLWHIIPGKVLLISYHATAHIPVLEPSHSTAHRTTWSFPHMWRPQCRRQNITIPIRGTSKQTPRITRKSMVHKSCMKDPTAVQPHMGKCFEGWLR